LHADLWGLFSKNQIAAESRDKIYYWSDFTQPFEKATWKSMAGETNIRLLLGHFGLTSHKPLEIIIFSVFILLNHVHIGP
jgi:hypothetical protein